MVELVELKNIIKTANKNTLVLCDELAKSSEFASSLIIVSSMI